MIIGEIRIVIIVWCLGMWFWFRLIVVMVFKVIDRNVVNGVICNEFLRVSC